MVGNSVEVYQKLRGWPSGGDPQDYFSNELGYKFYAAHLKPVYGGPGWSVVAHSYQFPGGFANSIKNFLKGL